jgi:hypothetical protein
VARRGVRTRGQVYFPWFSFWRSNPLADASLSLFVMVVEEVLLQDPDQSAHVSAHGRSHQIL